MTCITKMLDPNASTTRRVTMSKILLLVVALAAAYGGAETCRHTVSCLRSVLVLPQRRSFLPWSLAFSGSVPTSGAALGMIAGIGVTFYLHDHHQPDARDLLLGHRVACQPICGGHPADFRRALGRSAGLSRDHCGEFDHPGSATGKNLDLVDHGVSRISRRHDEHLRATNTVRAAIKGLCRTFRHGLFHSGDRCRGCSDIWRKRFLGNAAAAVRAARALCAVRLHPRDERPGKGQYRFATLSLYVLLTQPTHLVVVFPMAALWGTLFAIARLSAQSELTVMRASGLSLMRLAVLCAVIGFAYSAVVLLFGEFVAPSTEVGQTDESQCNHQCHSGSSVPDFG